MRQNHQTADTREPIPGLPPNFDQVCALALSDTYTDAEGREHHGDDAHRAHLEDYASGRTVRAQAERMRSVECDDEARERLDQFTSDRFAEWRDWQASRLIAGRAAARTSSARPAARTRARAKRAAPVRARGSRRGAAARPRGPDDPDPGEPEPPSGRRLRLERAARPRPLGGGSA